MKKIYFRELRHIMANYEITHKPTGYRSNSISATSNVIRKMIQWRWIEGTVTKDHFMFVTPTKTFLEKTWANGEKVSLN